jgi:predicted nucleic acid-binding protein
MSAKVFLDTNLWVYFYTKDPLEKTEIVSNLITENRHSLILSTQILGELYNVLTRKKLFTKPQTASIIKTLVNTFPIHDIDSLKVLKAIEISDRYGYTYWDSLILSTALLSYCTILYSEDMQHSQQIEGAISILNPFKT